MGFAHPVLDVVWHAHQLTGLYKYRCGEAHTRGLKRLTSDRSISSIRDQTVELTGVFQDHLAISYSADTLGS